MDGEEGVSVLDDIDFQVELMRNDLINVKYIMDLIGQINLSDAKARDEKRHQIHKLLDKADDQQLRLKADLIRSFLDKVVPSLKEDSDINEAYYEFEDKEKRKKLMHLQNKKPFLLCYLMKLLMSMNIVVILIVNLSVKIFQSLS